MKKLLLMTICILLLNGCDNKPKLPGTFVGSAGTISRRLLSETPEGYFIVQDYYIGRFAYTEPFKIKRKEDLTKGINDNDQFASALDLIDSIDGPLILYWADLWQEEQGPIILKGQYNEGKREGLWQGFYKNNQQAFQENYQQGKLEGKQQRWYESGKPRSEYHFQHGVVEGKSTLWYEETGYPLAELNFHNGLREGAYRYWYDNGQLWIEGQFENDKKQGQWTYWNRKGDKQKIIHYNQGAVVSETQLAPAFEKIKVDSGSICGSYQGHVLRIEYPYLLSSDYVFKKPTQQCKDELDRIVLSYVWPSLEPIREGGRIDLVPTHIRYETIRDVERVSLNKQLNISRTMSDKDIGQPKSRLRDPEIGLWRYDRLNMTNPSKVYWRYNSQGEVTILIDCQQYRSLMRMSCELVTYMPIYKIYVKVKFLENMLPQWPALEEQAKQFIERRIQN